MHGVSSDIQSNQAGSMTGQSGASPTLVIPVLLDPPPLAPWVRFGIIDRKLPAWTEAVAPVRVLRDFCLHLQLAGRSWVWCEAVQGSLDVQPGDLLFIPPGFVHAWAYAGETHLALHFDLQRNARLTPHNYDNSFDMIHFSGGEGERRPCTTMPLFQVHYPGQAAEEGWRIPLITPVSDVAAWQERLSALVYRWQIRALDTVAADLQLCHTLGWALETLAEQSTYADQRVDDPQVVALLQRLQDPEELAALSRCSIPELACMVGLGTTVFRQRFKGVTGRAPHQYIRERQIQQASALLKKSSLAIREIAHTLGFDDPYHFSRLFHQLMGCSPAQFRRR
jgi:AraC-like DNA-binding protein